MPLSYSVDAVEQIVTISGDYAGIDEWRALLTSLSDDPACQSGFAFLRDLRTGTVATDVSTVVGVMNVIGVFWPGLQPRRAAVLTKAEDTITPQVTQALADVRQLPIRSFTSYDEAVEWLRRPIDR